GAPEGGARAELPGAAASDRIARASAEEAGGDRAAPRPGAGACCARAARGRAARHESARAGGAPARRRGRYLDRRRAETGRGQLVELAVGSAEEFLRRAPDQRSWNFDPGRPPPAR